mmetsp:Transcript_41230/g.62733  ORF Transcript_41230/g.62733 Transcript_41230/m.62733 type:complete len:128 (+) Transcript_41230:2141-2524(+)
MKNKHHLDVESKWTKFISENENIAVAKIDSLVKTDFSEENFGQFDVIQAALSKAAIFISDLEGGIIKLGEACHPTNIHNSDNLKLFVDCLVAYGTNYINIMNLEKVYEHRQQRIVAIMKLHEIVKIL